MKTFLLNTNRITSREISIELLDYATLTIVVKNASNSITKTYGPKLWKISDGKLLKLWRWILVAEIKTLLESW